MNLPKIRRYYVLLSGNKKGISTDSIELAEKRAILGNGTVYEDIRYKARKRLQRLYVRALYNGANIDTFDYPVLLK